MDQFSEKLKGTVMRDEKVRPVTLWANVVNLKERYPRLWLAIRPIKIGGYGTTPTAVPLI